MAAEGQQQHWDSVSYNDRKLIRRNIELCRELPPPDQTFLASDIVGRLGYDAEGWQLANVLRRLEERGIVADAGEVKHIYGDRNYSMIQRWSTTDKGFLAIQELLGGFSNGALPCGHNAFVNLGTVLECKVCGRRHLAEEVRE